MQSIGLAAATGVVSLMWQGPAFAQPMFHRDWDGGPAWGWGHMMAGGLMMIVFWIVIVVLGVLFVRWLWRRPHSGPSIHGPTPLDELKRRFARGEIDEKDYRERKKVLGE
jgi:putative membrane protein